MEYLYDPHVHSDYSDGDFSPAEVVRQAKEKGIKGVVLCDHNTISGADEFLVACQKVDLTTFCGVEISTLYKGIDIHILGYSNKFNEHILKNGLKSTVEGYRQRSKEMVEKLKKDGFTNLEFEQILKGKKEGGVVMKHDILKAICKEKGKSFEEVKQFKYLLKRDGPGYVPYGDWAMSPFEAVELIGRAGGISIIAHPGDSIARTDISKEEVLDIVVDLIKKLKEKGMKGIEVRCFTHTDEQEKYFISLAKDLDLIITGGSDWHGEYHYPERIFGMIGSTKEEFQNLQNILP